MEPLLHKVFTALQTEKKVRTQTDLADSLDLTKGRVSQLLRTTGRLPESIEVALNKKFKISLDFLASGGKGSMFEGKTNKEVQDRLRGMLPESDVEVSDLSDEIKNSEKSNNSKNISLPSLSTNYEDMDRTLLDIVRMQVENDRQHAKNYAELIDLLRRDIPKEKAS